MSAPKTKSKGMGPREWTPKGVTMVREKRLVGIFDEKSRLIGVGLIYGPDRTDMITGYD